VAFFLSCLSLLLDLVAEELDFFVFGGQLLFVGFNEPIIKLEQFLKRIVDGDVTCLATLLMTDIEDSPIIKFLNGLWRGFEQVGNLLEPLYRQLRFARFDMTIAGGVYAKPFC